MVDTAQAAIVPNQECFVLMPISDVENYAPGHFKTVFEDIIAPACEMAKYKATRADQVKATSLIHLDILKKILDAPIAVCDLSTRNPNVLFELGIRQAFDKPVVLIQERGTPKIFDIAPLRYLEYCKELRYHDVLRTQKELKEAIEATVSADSDIDNVNSIVKLLSLSAAAKLPELKKGGKSDLALEVMQVEMRDLRRAIESLSMERVRHAKNTSIIGFEYERISNNLDKIQSNKRMHPQERADQLHRLMQQVEEVLMKSDDRSEHMAFRRLRDRVAQAIHEPPF